MPSATALPDLAEASISDLQDGLQAGFFTSVQLTQAYLRRIDEVQDEIRSIIAKSPKAIDIAAERDAERAKGFVRGPLHGIPITVKDNIATDFAIDQMRTTAGSHALANTITKGDAFLVSKLREAGAIILAKDNLSEWAFWRACGPYKDDTSKESRVGLPSGWSGVGGQTTCPYYPRGNPIGSSAGGGASTAAGLNAGALGSETFGSIISPSSRNNLVGVRPAPGLVSRHRVVPISSNADSVGPMTRCVKDAAILLSAIAGPDEADPITLEQPNPVPDYLSMLSEDSLKGIRIGLPSGPFQDYGPDGLDNADIEPLFKSAVDVLRELGAEIVDCEIENADALTGNRDVTDTMLMDFKAEIVDYLNDLKENPDNIHSVEDIIEFNKRNPDLEMPKTYEAQPGLERSAACPDRHNNPEYERKKHSMVQKTRQAVLHCMDKHNIQAFVMPGAQCDPWSAAQLPEVVVPIGFLPENRKLVDEASSMTDEKVPYAENTYTAFPGQPIGMTFAGRRFSEGQLMSYAYAYEQATHHRLKRKTYAAATAKTQLRDVIAK